VIVITFSTSVLASIVGFSLFLCGSSLDTSWRITQLSLFVLKILLARLLLLFITKEGHLSLGHVLSLLGVEKVLGTGE